MPLVLMKVIRIHAPGININDLQEVLEELSAQHIEAEQYRKDIIIILFIIVILLTLFELVSLFDSIFFIYILIIYKCVVLWYVNFMRKKKIDICLNLLISFVRIPAREFNSVFWLLKISYKGSFFSLTY